MTTRKIPIVWFEATDEASFYLRRYRRFRDERDEARRCAGPCTYCNAMTFFTRGKVLLGAGGVAKPDAPPPSDKRWPRSCEFCHEPFADDDEYQLFWDRIYRSRDGREHTLRELPPGSVYNATWYAEMPEYCGPDGRSLVVVLPGGLSWCIDGKASNCARPQDHTHKCWVRHGSPEDGTLHVDKNGNTCSAGAGSISVTGYHGFLHHGHLVEC